MPTLLGSSKDVTPYATKSGLVDDLTARPI